MKVCLSSLLLLQVIHHYRWHLSKSERIFQSGYLIDGVSVTSRACYIYKGNLRFICCPCYMLYCHNFIHVILTPSIFMTFPYSCRVAVSYTITPFKIRGQILYYDTRVCVPFAFSYKVSQSVQNPFYISQHLFILIQTYSTFFQINCMPVYFARHLAVPVSKSFNTQYCNGQLLLTVLSYQST